MTRQELAQQAFLLLRRTVMKKDIEIWQAIAETSDTALLEEYEKLVNQFYSVSPSTK